MSVTLEYNMATKIWLLIKLSASPKHASVPL